MKKAGLFDPYLDVMGGGEKHILSILRVLEDHGYEVCVYWDRDLGKDIKERLNLDFKNLSFRPNPFAAGRPAMAKLRELGGLDIFIYVTDGSYFFSPARKNFVFSMYPDPKLYRMGPANRIKTLNWRFIANSNFTFQRLADYGIKSTVIHPYIDDYLVSAKHNRRNDKIILSVGRFFEHLHAKRQDKAIEAFNLLQQNYPSFKEYKLYLAGSLKEEDKSYYLKLKSMAAANSNIEFFPNVPYERLAELYRQAKYYWHFAGYGIDETKEPEKVEHLGITPLEAMAAGCVVFCYRAGGPKALIDDGKNGFTFLSTEELLDKMKLLHSRPALEEKVIREESLLISGSFSREAFRRRVLQVLIQQ